MKHYFRYIVGFVSALVLSSCISNTIPYPVVELEILGVEGEGFTCSAEDIDKKTNTVTLHLEEQTDISKVKIDKITVTEQASSSIPLSGVFDLRTPLYLTLSFYQDYEWTIVAEQQIERYFEVESQIGASVIDPDRLIATAYVPMGTDLNNIKVTRLKLGPADVTTMTPSIEELTSFESVRYAYVSYHDIEQKWSLYVIPTEVSVQFTQVNAWSRVAWLYAEGLSGEELGFRYRKVGEEEWINVPSEKINVSGGAFNTCLSGLEPESQYEVIATSGSNETEIVTLTTEAAPLLINGGFEEWSTIQNIVCPYLSEETRYWGTGNPGAKIGNAVLTDKTEDIRPGSSGKYAAKLESKHVGIGSLVKIAAGNLFTGRYVATRATNGIVGFGRPFEYRPTALHGWVKYNRGLLTKVGELQPPGQNLKVGDPDNGVVYIALGTWTPEKYGVSSKESEMLGTNEVPIIIDTRDPNTFFNPNGEDVIAYGELPLTSTIEEWTEFTIPLKYVATDRKPTHIVIVCSASRWGDYFIGSNESALWVDDFELVYDAVDAPF